MKKSRKKQKKKEKKKSEKKESQADLRGDGISTIEEGVRVCGDAVLLDFWCGFAVIFILSCGIAVFQNQAVCSV